MEATVDQDQIRNVCTGFGKIKVRLGEGEDIETLKQQFVNAGLSVHENKLAPQKKPNFTY